MVVAYTYKPKKIGFRPRVNKDVNDNTVLKWCIIRIQAIFIKKI